MASISMTVTFIELSNKELEGAVKKFEEHLLEKPPFPNATLDSVEELDREEDESD